MQIEKQFLDEQGMIDLARKSIEVLRQQGASPTELRRLEILLKEGNVGEAFIISSLLRTILAEISPEASQKKLLAVYQGLSDICQSLVELSRNLFDIDAWQHYRDPGYETFESYCHEALGIPPNRVRLLMLVKEKCLPRRANADAASLFSWFFEVVDSLSTTKPL